MALTLGIHHLGLTVRDVFATRTFFVDVLGYTQVGERPDYPAVFVSDGTVMLTLWQVQDPATKFDRRHHVGLHHVALRVSAAGALAELHQRLAAHPEVSIEFAPEPLGTSNLKHMMCLIPGGIRVEFIADA